MLGWSEQWVTIYQEYNTIQTYNAHLDFMLLVIRVKGSCWQKDFRFNPKSFNHMKRDFLHCSYVHLFHQQLLDRRGSSCVGVAKNMTYMSYGVNLVSTRPGNIYLLFPWDFETYVSKFQGNSNIIFVIVFYQYICLTNYIYTHTHTPTRAHTHIYIYIHIML